MNQSTFSPLLKSKQSKQSKQSRQSRQRTALGLAALVLLAGSPLAAWSAPGGADAGVARGVLRAEREAVLSSALSERIVSMPVREGQAFKKGQTLVSFDCGRMAAELRAARAGASVEERNAKVQAELLAMDATGRADADIAQLKEKEREAQADVIRERMGGCKVVAPYAGRVVETLARPDETPAANEKLLRIVSEGPLELHMVVPSKWLTWLHKDSALAFKVDETGDTLQARVRRISAAVDAVSQTIKVVASVDKAPERVLPGMSGRALLEGGKDAQAALPDVAAAKPAPAAAPAAAIKPTAATPAAGQRAR